MTLQIKKLKVVKNKRVIAGMKKLMPGERSIESLSHFWCKFCKKWWSVGDAPLDKTEWFCPWCGEKNTFKIIKK